MVKHVLSEIPAKEYIISDERKAELDAMYSPEAEIARLQEQVETLTKERDCDPDGCKAHIDAFMARAEAAEAERDRLRAALEFYADTSKYPAPFTGGFGELYYDCGQIALAALQKEHQP